MDHLIIAGEQAIIADAFVIEGGQHQDLAKARIQRRFGQLNGIGQGATAGADHQLVLGDARVGGGCDYIQAFGDGKGIRLARGAQHRDTVAAIAEQPFVMRHHFVQIDRQVGTLRRYGGAPDARKGVAHIGASN